MRIKRQKNFRKHMQFYRNNFKFRESYRVLIDGTFINDALKNRIDIREQVTKILGGKIVPMVTQCCYQELRNLGGDFKGSVHIAKQFYRLKCEHDPCLPADQCMKAQIGEANATKYVVCTQDKALRNHVRKIPGVPLLSMHGCVPFLEAPSSSTKQSWQDAETDKLKMKGWEEKSMPILKKKAEVAKKREELQKQIDSGEIDEATRQRLENQEKKARKFGKKKGVNPLAMKKSKKVQKQAAASSSGAGSSGVAKTEKKKKTTRSRRSRPKEAAAA